MDIRPISSFTPSPAPAPLAPRAQGSTPAAPGKDVAATGQAKAAEAAPARTPEKEELAEALKSINMALKDRTPGLEFSIDADSQRAIVKVVDRDTQEVIRQMPSVEALEIAKSLETLQGLLEKQSA
jgi:flagellar protein FlaG